MSLPAPDTVLQPLISATIVQSNNNLIMTFPLRFLVNTG